MTQQLASQNEPIATLPFLYLTGLQLSNDGTTPNTILDVASGQCRDSTNQFDMVLSSTTLLNTGNVGLNGLDTGVLLASKIYAVFLIADPSGYRPTGLLLSLSATSPLLPFGYGLLRRIGWAVTDASVHFLKFTQLGANSARSYFYDTMPQVLTAGAATSFTAVDMTVTVPAVPPIVTSVTFNYVYTPSSAAHSAYLRATGSAATVVPALQNSAAAAGGANVTILCGVATSLAEVDYKVTSSDTLSLWVYSYQDQL